MKKLLEERQRLEAQIEALKQQLIGLNRAIALLNGEEAVEAQSQQQPKERKPRSSVKEVVLKLLEESRDAGLTANETVDLAAQRGIALDRGSVSSYLSRLKREGVLVLRDSKYRIASCAGAAENAPSEAVSANLH